MEIKRYTPHKYQQLIHADKSRYRVVVAGRRFGKSKLSRWDVLWEASVISGRYWIVSPTITQGKTNHWTQPDDNILLETAGWRTYENSQDLAIEIPAKNGKSSIELKGIEKLKKTRGAGLAGVVLDEAPHLSRYAWEGVIEPMLLTTRGWALFTGTPNGMNWFKDIFEQGRLNTQIIQSQVKGINGDFPIWQAQVLKNPQPSKPIYAKWSSWHFTSYDSPLNSFEDLNDKRLRAIEKNEEDWFFQEYIADFRKVSGLIYKSFDRGIHTIDPFDIPLDWAIYRSIDFGFDNPTACIWIAVSPEGKWYVVDEYYEQKESSDYHIGIILSKSGLYSTITMTFGDPSAPQIIKDWATKGIYITPAKREMGTNLGSWVGHGIDLVQEKLKVSLMDNKSQLFVFKNCKNTIREFETYRWKEEKDDSLNKPGRPVKANDHLLDALRYFAVSYQQQIVDYMLEDHKDWSFI